MAFVITMIRALMPRISGISDEIMMIAMPLAARSEISRGFRLGSDVDAPCRFVEVQDRGFVIRQRATAFLLVAARELPMVSFSVGVLIRNASCPRRGCERPLYEPGRCVAADRGDLHVFPHRVGEEAAAGFPVLRQAAPGRDPSRSCD